MSSSPKKGRGRQKIELKKMSNTSNLHVTFTKRRGGLVKKASELCTLCGADLALIVFSPGDKVYSFGNPHVDAVIDRYVTGAPPPCSGTDHFIAAHRNATVRDLNARLSEITSQLEAERNRSKELARLKKVAQSQFWWARPVNEMSETQLDQYQGALEGLKKHVKTHAAKAILQSVVNPAPSFPGVSSSGNPVHQAHPPQEFSPQLIQPLMHQNHMFGDGTTIHPHGFNNMGMGGHGSGGGHMVKFRLIR